MKCATLDLSGIEWKLSLDGDSIVVQIGIENAYISPHEAIALSVILTTLAEEFTEDE